MADCWIKFCGCRSWNDVEQAVEAGADAFGMIFAPSPRQISSESASDIARRVPVSIEPVAVFVNPPAELVESVRALFPRLRLQFSGDETPDFVARFGERAIKAIHVDAEATLVGERAARFPEATLLLDARHDGLAGGTGRTFAWEHAVALARGRRVVVAGGLTPENVQECVRSVRPFGVDVRNGIETNEGKDLEKMRAFVRAVREA